MDDEKGKCLIFSAPSGSGKTTVVRHLLRHIPELSFSVSATSREPRPGETPDKDYIFLGADEFREKVDAGDFLEWEEVYPNRLYGTLKSEVKRVWNNEKHVVFDVDVEGGVSLKKIFGERALSVFVQAPSIAALEERLRARSTETEESIQARVQKAGKEMEFADKFDRVLVNDNLNEALKSAEQIAREFLEV
ncbi:MAG TPA: guanylate kinase [Cryomorphaceae bacterium]|nr:guanylate kinase [Cryomorphaceae bacterium]